MSIVNSVLALLNIDVSDPIMADIMAANRRPRRPVQKVQFYMQLNNEAATTFATNKNKAKT